MIRAARDLRGVIMAERPARRRKERILWVIVQKGATMARKYSKTASKKVGRAMRERKKGTLKSGRSGRKVASRKKS